MTSIEKVEFSSMCQVGLAFHRNTQNVASLAESKRRTISISTISPTFVKTNGGLSVRKGLNVFKRSTLHIYHVHGELYVTLIHRKM